MYKVSIIGGGKMGEAILSGLLQSGVYTSKDIQVAEILETRRRYLTKIFQIECSDRSKDVVEFGDVIIVAVKPTNVGNVLTQIRSFMTTRKIVISIAAGIPLKFLREHLDADIPIFRAMPNLACSVREAMIVYCTSDNVNSDDQRIVSNILGLLGRTIQLDEAYLNLATGLVGSGPAFIFVIIDAIADAGVRLGLPKEVAILLAAQTTLGAAKMVVETGEHPIKLKDMVATPGGTTVEGLLELDKGKLRAVLITAVTEAATRAKELQPTASQQ